MLQTPCPNCQMAVGYQEASAGGLIGCPHCGQTIRTPADVPQRTIPDVRTAAPMLPNKARKSNDTSYSAAVFGVIFFLAAMGAFMVRIGYSDSLRFGGRFQSDNAIGATANAAEQLAGQPSFGNPDMLLIGSLLCWLIWSIEKLRLGGAPRSGD
jgi:hypothetical protein